MSVIKPDADKCLIAACVCLSLRGVRDQAFKDALMMLREIIPDSGAYSSKATPLHVAAINLVEASRGTPFDNALSRLKMETQFFFRDVTARRYNSWRKIVGSAGAGG
jgi:hypothetical protein